VLGVGFRYAGNFVKDDAHDAFIVVGVIILALGVGFIVASLMAFVLSSRLGLFPPSPLRNRSPPMREITLTDMERLGAFDEAERTFQMTEEAFRAFYELTARPVRVYLARMTGDDRLADDLLQETYYRFLRANRAFDSDDHRPQLPVPHRHQPGPRPSPQAVHGSAGGGDRRSA
jgi:hypothetical protein